MPSAERLNSAARSLRDFCCGSPETVVSAKNEHTHINIGGVFESAMLRERFAIDGGTGRQLQAGAPCF